MSASERLRIIFEAVTGKASSDVRGFGKDIEDVDKAEADTTKSHQGRMGRFRDATVAGFGVAQVLGFAKEIFNTGTALEAMDAKAKTVFGSQIGRVRDWAEENAGAMGLTKAAAIGAGAGIADLLKPMGFTAEAATDQTLKLLDLSAALAAWSGGQQDAAGVSEILTKAMLGEREQLKSLGISITEADVTARLAVKGQKELTGATLAQAKAVATQELIYEKSADAQKAWADGSMDSTKEANENQAAMSELGDVIAKSLLPAIKALVPILTEAGEILGDLEPVLGVIGDGIGLVGDAVSGVRDGAEWLARDLGKPFREEVRGSISETAFTIGRVAEATVEAGDAAKQAAQDSYELGVEQEALAERTEAVTRALKDEETALRQLRDEIRDEEAAIASKDAMAEMGAEIERTGSVSDATRLKVEAMALGLTNVSAARAGQFKIALDNGDLERAVELQNQIIALAAIPVKMHVTIDGQIADATLRNLMERGTR